MLAELFVERFVQHDPELQDEPFLMITLVVLNSFIIVAGYLPSLFPRFFFWKRLVKCPGVLFEAFIKVSTSILERIFTGANAYHVDICV